MDWGRNLGRETPQQSTTRTLLLSKERSAGKRVTLYLRG